MHADFVPPDAHDPRTSNANVMTPQLERLRFTLVAAILFIATFAVFGRSMRWDFVDYDDPDFVTENTHVRAGISHAELRWAFGAGGRAANWQPVTWISLMLDAEIHGVSPAGFHATNVFFHSCNAVLALLLLYRLTGAFWPSAWSAALFALHPLRVESVAWVAERKDVLSVCFGLLTVLAYLGYATRVQRRQRGAGAFYIAAVFTFALGLMAKPMLVTLPAIMTILDVWPCGRWSAERDDAPAPRRTLLPWIDKLPFVVLALVVAWITYAVQRNGGAMAESFDLSTRSVNAVVSIARYLGKTLWPVNLAVCYPHPGNWPPLAFGAALLVIATVTAIAVFHRRERPGLLAGWLWFLITLLPVLGFVQVGAQAMADRYTYFPTLGLAVLFIAAVDGTELLTVAPKLAAGIAAAMIAACGTRTWDQLRVWQSSTTLFEHALAVTTDNYIAHTCRANTLIAQGHLAPALEHARSAIEARPTYAPAHYTLGLALEKLGRGEEAIASYSQAIALRRSWPAPRLRRGTISLHSSQAAEALQDFTVAAQLDSDSAPARFGEALALVALNRPDEAVRAFEDALRLKPDYAEAHNSYANLLAARGAHEAAWAHYEAAIRAKPEFAEAHFNFGNSLDATGHSDRAYPHYQAACRLQPLDPDYQYGAAVALEHLHRTDEAIAAYRQTVRLKPDHAEAHYFLGAALRSIGRLNEAAAEWREVLRLAPNQPGMADQLAELQREIASHSSAPATP